MIWKAHSPRPASSLSCMTISNNSLEPAPQERMARRWLRQKGLRFSCWLKPDHNEVIWNSPTVSLFPSATSMYKERMFPKDWKDYYTENAAFGVRVIHYFWRLSLKTSLSYYLLHIRLYLNCKIRKARSLTGSYDQAENMAFTRLLPAHHLMHLPATGQRG